MNNLQATVYTVTTTADAGVGSLRQAIIDANGNAGADVIQFNISGGGPHTITLSSALPALSDATGGTTIDGTSQTGWSANTVLPINASSGTPMFSTSLQIEISQTIAATSTFSLTSNNNIIQGICIQDAGSTAASNFDRAINITGDGNQVLGCIIGLDPGGTTSSNTSYCGVWIEGGDDNLVGNGTAAGANIISGNSSYGVFLVSSGTGNVVKGNMLGLQRDGETITANGQSSGVVLQSISAQIGGTGAGDGNVISGNTNTGVGIINAVGTVYGNIIGPQANGNTVVTSNSQNIGISIPSASSNNVIGGTSSAHRNVISGNLDQGIRIYGSFGATFFGNQIMGNYIGLAKNGTSFITSSSQDDGIEITWTNVASYNTNVIGGSSSAYANIISGNTVNGISITGKPMNITNGGLTISGNIIGLQSDGATVMSTSQTYGVYLSNMPGVYVGGSTSGERNTISGNDEYGIYLTGSTTTGNIIKGNYIGLQSDGATDVASSSQDYGVYITSSTNNNIIGGINSGEGNVISANDVGTNNDYGIYINSTHADGNEIYGNIIGLQSNGSSLVTNGNQAYGIYITGSPNNTIGGSTSGHRNVISSCPMRGIHIRGAGSTGNVVKGNYIGLAADGTTDIASNPQFVGVELTSSATDNIIGGTASGEPNVISGNRQGAFSSVGVWINATDGNSVIGNYIGCAADGQSDLTGTSNQNAGVAIYSGDNNTIQANTIMGNTLCGIWILEFGGGAPTGNVVKGNYIGVANDGSTTIYPNSQDYGIWFDDQAGATYPYDNIIGGTGAGEGNVISGNDDGSDGGIGIYMQSPNTNGNTIIGNIIGPQGDGNTFLNNAQEHGIYLDASPGNTIGGSTSAHRNVISGNDEAGIYFTGTCTGNQVKGNYIGIAGNGTTIVTSATQNRGIRLSGSSVNNTIGGTNSGEGNLISGNNDGFSSGLGIIVESSTGQNTIIGNIIGPQKDGSTLLASSLQAGGLMLQGTNSIVGGSTAGARNIISGNTSYGAGFAVNSTGNVIKGNYIGLASDGITFISGSSQDYGLLSAGNYNTIGGTGAGEGNLISGNSNAGGIGYGIWGIVGNNNGIYGNIIGPQKDGSTLVASNEQDYGIYFSVGANNNTIGGSTSNHRNIISANNECGLYITDASTSGNLVKGNYIGTAIDGASQIGSSSQDVGVHITSSANNNVIGGTNSGEGNVITGNTGATYDIGIYLQSTNTIGNQVYGNIIGPQSDGSTAFTASQVYGIYIDDSPNNIIGGSSSGFRNVVSNNILSGIYITGASSSGTEIKGNYIGLATDGSSVIASATQLYGVALVSGVPGTTIGGTNSGEGNIISANNTAGIQLANDDNEIYGNIIGTYSGATTTMSGSQVNGILLSSSDDNIIGGSSSAHRNVISDNATYGVLFDGSSTGNSVKGNYIGPATDGSSFITSSGQDWGIELRSTCNNNTFGGANSGEGNVISGNTANGINMSTDNNQVYGNIIGLQKDGVTEISTSTQYAGISLGGNDNIIGGSSAGHRNVISGNYRSGAASHLNDGIYITGGASGNSIKGNYIGVGTDGSTIPTASAQQRYGIYFWGSGSNAGPGNVIGGTNAGEGNVISGNGYSSNNGYGIYQNSDEGNMELYGNIIGLDASGATIISGSQQNTGVYLANSSIDNTIGGSSSSHRNVISGNNQYGVYITGASTTGTILKGNYIGIAADGTSFVGSSSQDYGLYLSSSSPPMVIGGTKSGEGNVISGNTGYGVFLTSADDNEIYGNVIGAAASGTTSLGANNQNHGVYLTSSDDVIIGGSTSAYRNVISDNRTTGVNIGAASTGNQVKGNYIGLAADGATFITSSNQASGVYLNGATAKFNTIGGTNSGEGNVISGNTAVGVEMTASSNNNYVYGNIIGPQKDGSTNVTNNAQTYGVRIGWIPTTDSKDNIIGHSSGDPQVISANLTYGVFVYYSGSTGNVIKANYIGTASDGSSAIASSSQDYGVYLNSAASNEVGTGVTSDGNIIAHNTNTGVYVTGASAVDNLISRNLIYSNTSMAIDNVSSGNAEYTPPTIYTGYNSTTVYGGAQANDIIEVFKKVAGGSDHCQQAQVYLGTTTANGSGAWTFNPGGTILNAGDTPLATARSNTNNNTSEFDCPSTAVGLPVELLTFTAEKQSSTSVITKWTTATEINNDYFTVEASPSANGGPSQGGELNWHTVGIVNGAGNSSTLNHYSLVDNAPPLDNGNGWVYYRLKQTDFDGSAAYSDIVAVDFSANKSTVSIYPNPTDGSVINIATNFEGSFLLVLRDALGKEVFAKEYNNPNIFLHDDVNLSAGVYSITIHSENSSATQKLIVR